MISRASDRRPGRKARRQLLASIGLALLGACASSGDHRRIAPEDLLEGKSLQLTAPASAVPEQQDVLAVTPDMQQFLDAHVEPGGSGTLKLNQLVSAIIDPKKFGLEYDDVTRTASETFRQRRGNCLSFASLFVAMARQVGLKVEFEEVDIPPDWTLDKDTYVLNQHVNVRVDLGPEGMRVVDFNIADFKTTYPMRTIDDTRAYAHYYNNIGVARMQTGDKASALECFRRAISTNDKLFSPAWCNLGTLYLRQGDRERAEASYLEALEVNDTDLVAMSNLARLYKLEGDHDRAAAYRKRVLRHQNQNPYYRYDVARQSYAMGRFDEAIGHLKFAIRKRPKEDQFYFLLALTYLGKGDSEAARRWLARAQEVASTDSLKRRYSSKIDILLKQHQ